MSHFFVPTLRSWLPSSPESASPPPTVFANFNTEPYRIPTRNHVSLTLYPSRLHVAASHTKFFRKHFLSLIELDLPSATVVSARSMRVDGKVSALVLLSRLTVAALVDHALLFFDLRSKSVCCHVPQLENVASVSRLDGRSVLAFCTSAAYVIRINDDSSHDIRQIDEPVSSHISCAYGPRFVTLHDEKAFVWQRDSLQAESFEHGIVAPPTTMSLNERWLVIHVRSSSLLFVYDAQTYQLQRMIQFKPNKAASICMRQVGDLVLWNDIQRNVEDDLPLLTLGIIDVTTGSFVWRRAYTTCHTLPSSVLPPFEVLEDGTILMQTSNYVFETYRLPENLTHLVRSNLQQRVSS